MYYCIITSWVHIWYIHTYNIYRVLRWETYHKRWMALDCASYRHRIRQRSMWYLA